MKRNEKKIYVVRGSIERYKPKRLPLRKAKCETEDLLPIEIPNSIVVAAGLASATVIAMIILRLLFG